MVESKLEDVFSVDASAVSSQHQLMSTPSYFRRRLKPQLINPRAIIRLRHASGSPTAAVETGTRLTPSQLLRFSLAGTTAASNQAIIQDVFDQWPLDTPPPPSLGLFTPRRQSHKGVPLQHLKQLEDQVKLVQDLQAFIEQNVTNASSAVAVQLHDGALLRKALRKCEGSHSYGEILSVVNGIVARLARLGARGRTRAPVLKSTHVLGMHYACLSFCAPALYRHLEGYSQVTSDPLDLETSSSLVDALLNALQSIQFGNKESSPLPMLNLVTGEGRASSAPKLHDILSWKGPNDSSGSIQRYILLLIKLGSQRILRGELDKLLREVPSDVRFPDQSTYAWVLALADAGKPKDARTYMRQISERCDGTLPGISKFCGLPAMLANKETSELLPETAGQLEYMAILQRQLCEIEARLGIEWQPMGSSHTSMSDSQFTASGKPLLGVEGDCTGFDGIERLIASIQISGRSKSYDDLGIIADLLNEHDGSEIPVSLPTLEDSPCEFAWRPQCSPIEFSNAPHPIRYDSSVPWSPSTLGLIRARVDSEAAPGENDGSLHLMQLGYLVMRPRIRASPSNTAHSGDRPWQETGHIVALDRLAGNFLMVFVGKGYGLLDPGVLAPILQPQLGFSAVAPVFIPRYLDKRDLKATDYGRTQSRVACLNRAIGIHFEVEPGVELL